MKLVRRLLGVGLWLLAGPSVGAQLPDDATLEALGAVVGEVRILRQDVFDTGRPEENRRLFRLANRLHADTREAVIRRQLLFAPGEPYQRRRLAESERLLRRNRYLFDAQIEPVAFDGERVDVEVRTRDVWTLQVGAGFSRSGGANGTRFELQDSNFLGSGKDITLERLDDVDRSTLLARYRDPALAGSRVELEATYADLSDGSRRQFTLARPFYALDVRWAAGFEGFEDDRQVRFFRRGKEVARVRHEQAVGFVFWGHSRGLEAGRVRRTLWGLAYADHKFSPVAGEALPSGGLPPDRRVVAPWVVVEGLTEDFQETRDLDLIQRTEDLALGLRWRLEAGVSPEALGGDRDRLFTRGEVAGSHTLGARGGLLLASATAGSRWTREGGENGHVGFALRWHRRTFRRHVLFARLGADRVYRQDREEQLLLGGDNGLRGYPLRYQDGDRRVLLTLEQRFFSERHWFQLLYAGAAVFADVGRAWAPGRVGDPGWLADVGVGLRLSSSRSSRGTMVHLDVALPLRRDGGIDSVQWLVRTRETF